MVEGHAGSRRHGSHRREGGVELRRSLTIPSALEHLEMARAFVCEALHDAGLPALFAHHMVLAVDEAVTSTVRESVELSSHVRSPIDSDATVEILLEVDSVRFKATIRDSTTDYGEHLSDRDLDSVLRRTQRNELGIFLMRRVCDEVNYSFMSGFQNQLELVKFFF